MQNFICILKEYSQERKQLLKDLNSSKAIMFGNPNIPDPFSKLSFEDSEKEFLEYFVDLYQSRQTKRISFCSYKDVQYFEGLDLFERVEFENTRICSDKEYYENEC